MADPAFPRGGAPTPRGGANMILPNFLKNCMKLKEFGPTGRAHVPRTPLDLPLLGFPVRGGANPLGVPTYNFAKFPQKLHEIVKILGHREGGTRRGTPLDPPL